MHAFSSADCGKADGGTVHDGVGMHTPTALHQRGAGYKRGDWHHGIPGEQRYDFHIYPIKSPKNDEARKRGKFCKPRKVSRAVVRVLVRHPLD